MFAQNASGNNPHQVGVIVPYQTADDERWINFAGRRLADEFGGFAYAAGMRGEAVIVLAITFSLTELDLVVLYRIGQQVKSGLGREGVAIVVDGDILML